MDIYRDYMLICEELAQKAGEKGNAPVGCIIVKGTKIIAQAEEAGNSKEDITAHAEIEAIRQARTQIGKDMSDCVLITTHEPCLMCAYPIRFHGISKVIYKHKVKHLGSISSNFSLLSTQDVPEHWSDPPETIQIT